MNKTDEGKWIHPLTLAMLDAVYEAEERHDVDDREYQSIIKEGYGLYRRARYPLLTDEAKAKLEEQDDGMCDACTGSGKDLFGEPCCLCNGTGRAFIAVINLRVKFYASEEELDKAKVVLAAVEKALEQCENCRGRLTFNSCNSGGVQTPSETQECPLASIRRVWKDEK